MPKKGKFYLDPVDEDDGSKTYHVCLGGQTVCMVPEDLFEEPEAEDSDVTQARKWAEKIAEALNKSE